jgi:Uma2 family endonuclease
VRPRATPSVTFTYDDFLHFPDDGKRHEIIGGDHLVTPSPNTKHQRIVGQLYFALVAYLRNNRAGEVFVAPFDVVLSDRDIVQPDLLYISRERSSVITEKHVHGAPDLVVEILSPGAPGIDEITKRDLYESCGVHEYWVVDPELDTISIDRRVEGAFVRSAELATGKDDELTTPLLPGFSVKVAEVFESPF